MVISKTPVRVSFFGGGTDYHDYYAKYGGAILSTTIDKYIYVSVNKLSGISDFKFKIFYSSIEVCNSILQIKHPVVRACLAFLNIDTPLEIHVMSDLPAKSGIGSSSSFTVGLLHALYFHLGIEVSRHQLALDAIHIERNILNERVGVQDQLAASYGGFNHMCFDISGELIVERLNVESQRLKDLNNSLLMFYTGITRYAHAVLEEQMEKTKNEMITSELAQMKSLVKTGIEILQGNVDLSKFGELLHQSWILKKGLSESITNSHLDEIYQRAINSGAIGGKLLGAGGGGFFIFYVPQHKIKNVKRELASLHLVDYSFETEGSTIIKN